MMSLTIYSDRHRPPEGVNIITQNDVYFNGAVELTGSKLEAVILHHIDRARYCSSRSFYGISSGTVPVDKNQLSTGTKTLLNVLSNPALCFDLRECGDMRWSCCRSSQAVPSIGISRLSPMWVMQIVTSYTTAGTIQTFMRF